MSESNQPWWIVAAAALPPFLIAVFQRYRDSADKRADRQSAEDVRLNASMDAAQLAAWKRQEERLERAEKRCDQCEMEREAAEQKARAANDALYEARQLCRELTHDRNNLRHTVTQLLKQMGKEPPTWPADPAP